MRLTATGIGGERWCSQIAISSLESELFVFRTTINCSLFSLPLTFIFASCFHAGVGGFQEAEAQETWEERVQSHDSSKPAPSLLSHHVLNVCSYSFYSCWCWHRHSRVCWKQTVLKSFCLAALHPGWCEKAGKSSWQSLGLPADWHNQGFVSCQSSHFWNISFFGTCGESRWM